MKTIRYGVVGCGYFGGELARIVHSMEGAALSAVFGGRDAAELAEELGCEAEESLDRLVQRDDIDAVIVASPSHLHYEAAVKAARNGKHVFCEKPLALTLKDCEEMLEASRECGVTFMAGHIMHFMRGVKRVKEWIAAGEIGRPLVCHSERTGWEERQRVVSWKKNRMTSGGHLFHHIHELDLLQAIMGPAVSVSAAGGNLAHQGEGFGDEEDVLLLTLEFSDGRLGTMQYGSGFRWGEHYVKINGSEGAILLDMKHSRIQLKNRRGLLTEPLNYSEEEDAERALSYEKLDGGIVYGSPQTKLPGWLTTVMKLEMEAFRDVLQGKPADGSYGSLFDGSAGRASIATAEAAMTALHERSWVGINHK